MNKLLISSAGAVYNPNGSEAKFGSMPCVIQALVPDTYTSDALYQPLPLGSGFFLV